MTRVAAAGALLLFAVLVLSEAAQDTGIQAGHGRAR